MGENRHSSRRDGRGGGFHSEGDGVSLPRTVFGLIGSDELDTLRSLLSADDEIVFEIIDTQKSVQISIKRLAIMKIKRDSVYNCFRLETSSGL